MTGCIVPQEAMPTGVFPFVARCGEERQYSPLRRSEMVLVSRHAEQFELFWYHIRITTIGVPSVAVH